MLSSSNLQLSLSYLKLRTIRDTPQKWVGFGKPLLVLSVIAIVVVCHKNKSKNRSNG